jgi:DNA-binding CsgD family transcriptional regulator
MHINLAQYDDVIHCIYDAALRQERWSGVIARLAEMQQAHRGVLFTYAHSPAQGGFCFTHNIPSSAIDFWAVKSMYEDPFVKSAMSKGLMVEGIAMRGVDLIGMDELFATDFYKELWQPIDIAQVCYGVVFDGTDAHKLPTVLSLFRGLHDPPFQQEHAQLLLRLLRHVSRALGVMFHLRDSQQRLADSTAALDRLNTGVLLVDSCRKVQFANAAARSILQTGDLVMLDSPATASPLQLRLHYRLARFETTFQQSIEAALRPLTEDADHQFTRALLLPGAGGEARCVVHVAPLAGNAAFPMQGGAGAIVFLYDLKRASSVSPQLLCETFGMTPAEALAALEITRGGSIEEMAARLGVSANTFKTQLQSAYVKSGTHRQVDLLKLLVSLSPR